MHDEDQQPGFLTMVGFVALFVAVVILVFFGIGYLFGRAFL
jgi:type IV secretory pathway VirB2 component (pilin)